jgi:hypothetical protein
MEGNLCVNTRATTARKIVHFVIVVVVPVLAGCSFTGAPRARIGYLPTATFGIPFADPNHLGTHAYGWGFLFEVSGLVYTCRGGHIDLDHVRGNADDVRYLFKKMRRTLSKHRRGFSFILTGEVSAHKVSLTYPEGWDERPDKDEAIDKIALDTAQYLAFSASTWHEIITWFGVHFALFEPEFNSAFSWEDIYSNVIGTQIGVEVMKEGDHAYNKRMTAAIYRRLKELGVQPRSTAIAASKKVRGQWYTGNFVPDMKMRNFDIGLDGTIMPTLVPGVPGCHSKPAVQPAPSLDTLKRYGFTMTYEIKPNLILEQGRIFKAAGSKRIFPERDFPILIEYMKKDATRRGYQYTE